MLVVRRGESASITGETSLTSAFEFPEDCAPNSPPTCTAAMTDALVCADDGENTVASVATLSAMARGTYAVVIDSFRPEGGRFSLVISAE